MFGKRNYFNDFLRATLAIAVGVVMIVTRTDAMVLAVQIIASFMLISGMVSLLAGARGGFPGIWIMGCGGPFNLLLAVIMFAFPESVAGLIMFFVGVALVGSGIFRFMRIQALAKVYPVSIFSYIMPVLIAILGFVLMFAPSVFGEAVGFVAGGALILYGLSELFTIWKMKKSGHKDDIINVEYTKVDEQ